MGGEDSDAPAHDFSYGPPNRTGQKLTPVVSVRSNTFGLIPSLMVWLGSPGVLVLMESSQWRKRQPSVQSGAPY
jgi:hypothetical protein